MSSSTEVSKGWDGETELARHQWADALVMQFPVSWMGTPWSLKKYMDEVYTAGMDGRLCRVDGRRGPGQDHLYGLGGALTDTRYMLSLTFNAPRDAFENPDAAKFKVPPYDVASLSFRPRSPYKKPPRRTAFYMARSGAPGPGR